MSETTPIQPSATDGESIHIFISHKVTDEPAVRVVRSVFNQAGFPRLKIHTCEDIPAGKDWREWIEQEIGNSNCLLFLYTRPRDTWDWSLFETGLFYGLQKGPVIVLHNPSSGPPGPIRNVQAVRANEKGIKDFLKKFFGTIEITNMATPINPEYAKDEQGHLSRDAAAISAFFEGELDKRHFTERMFLRILDTNSLDQGIVPSDSIVEAGPSLLSIFGLLERGETNPWTWEELAGRLEKDGNSKLVIAIEQSLCKANKSELFDQIQYIYQPRQSPKKYRVVLHSMEIGYNGEKKFCVLFFEQISGATVPCGPQQNVTLLSCLTLGSRLQWEVYDRFIPVLSDDYADGDDEGLVEQVSELIDDIERDAAYRENLEYEGSTTRDRLVWAFETRDWPSLEENIGNQRRLKNQLKSMINQKNCTGVLSNLRELQALNTDLVTKVARRYNEILSEDGGRSATA
jgi:hypothetical protein